MSFASGCAAGVRKSILFASGWLHAATKAKGRPEQAVVTLLNTRSQTRREERRAETGAECKTARKGAGQVWPEGDYVSEECAECRASEQLEGQVRPEEDHVSEELMRTAQAEDPANRTSEYRRSQQRVLMIGPGFGSWRQPHVDALHAAGFQLTWLQDLPNPEVPDFPMIQYLERIKEAIEGYRPHLIVSWWRGGAYVVALLSMGLWRGPTLMINKHPSLAALPKDVSIVVAHEKQDQYYKVQRKDLEALIRTGSENRCLLYNECLCDSCTLGQGCLAQLCDATISPDGHGPEMQLVRSWSAMLGDERVWAESSLGYTTRDLRRRWQSTGDGGSEQQVLNEVPPGCEEHRHVLTIFGSTPKQRRNRHGPIPGNPWVLRVERVENRGQEEGVVGGYLGSLERDLASQGLRLQPGLHTRWVFHGTQAVESVVFSEKGFDPKVSRAGSVWGLGTYFARDAKYVYSSGLARNLPDGSKQILLCLLATGMSCLGDVQHTGELPIRQGNHRYNTSVDSLFSPEFFITPSAGAAYPAYLITYRI